MPADNYYRYGINHDDFDRLCGDEEEEYYVITPKGIFALALFEAGFIDSVDDIHIDVAWAVFEKYMKRSGYVVEGEAN